MKGENKFNFGRVVMLILSGILLSFLTWSCYLAIYAFFRINFLDSLYGLFCLIVFCLISFMSQDVLFKHYKITEYEKIIMAISAFVNIAFLVLHFGIHFTIT